MCDFLLSWPVLLLPPQEPALGQNDRVPGAATKRWVGPIGLLLLLVWVGKDNVTVQQQLGLKSEGPGWGRGAWPLRVNAKTEERGGGWWENPTKAEVAPGTGSAFSNSRPHLCGHRSAGWKGRALWRSPQDGTASARQVVRTRAEGRAQSCRSKAGSPPQHHCHSALGHSPLSWALQAS